MSYFTFYQSLTAGEVDASEAEPSYELDLAVSDWLGDFCEVCEGEGYVVHERHRSLTRSCSICNGNGFINWSSNTYNSHKLFERLSVLGQIDIYSWHGSVRVKIVYRDGKGCFITVDVGALTLELALARAVLVLIIKGVKIEDYE